MLKRVDVATYNTIDAFCKGEFAAGTQVFDLSVDGVGYSTTGGFIDDITDQLDDVQGADHQRRRSKSRRSPDPDAVQLIPT